MKPYFPLIFLAAVLFLPIKIPKVPYSFNGTVVGILEGDLVRVLHKGKILKVRLSDVDCPEEGQAYGKEAKEFTKEMVHAGPVTVHVKKLNRFGTPVGEIVLKDAGLNLNRELIKAGLAWWKSKNSDDTSYGDLEETARKIKIGLWKQDDPNPPWEFRERGGDS